MTFIGEIAAGAAAESVLRRVGGAVRAWRDGDALHRLLVLLHADFGALAEMRRDEFYDWRARDDLRGALDRVLAGASPTTEAIQELAELLEPRLWRVADADSPRRGDSPRGGGVRCGAARRRGRLSIQSPVVAARGSRSRAHLREHQRLARGTAGCDKPRSRARARSAPAHRRRRRRTRGRTGRHSWSTSGSCEQAPERRCASRRGGSRRRVGEPAGARGKAARGSRPRRGRRRGPDAGGVGAHRAQHEPRRPDHPCSAVVSRPRGRLACGRTRGARGLASPPGVCPSATSGCR